LGLFIHHPLSLEHDTGAHPENARRVVAIERRLAAEGWHDLERVEAPAATDEQLERVHSRAHIEAIEAISAGGGGMIDVDTVASARSYEAALRAAGGAIDAAGRLLKGEERFAFCALRPPGHHAETGRAMGFCLFNNIACAVAHALAASSAERVMVIDWDVHHGNGTQEIFYGSAAVLYASIHQSPLYPGTGGTAETGSGEGEGYTVNLPVPPGSGSDEFLSLVQHVLAPLARGFRPDLIAISAGYDAHRDDPLAECAVETAAYGEMAATLRDVAAELRAPVLVCLEGGYALEALADSVSATIAAFTGSMGTRAAPPQPALEYLGRLPERWATLRK
jgi:acetoin utilization deacetylase AcuC-like enzyme